MDKPTKSPNYFSALHTEALKAKKQEFNLLFFKVNLETLSIILLTIFQTSFIFNEEFSILYSQRETLSHHLHKRSTIMHRNSVFNRIARFFDVLHIIRGFSLLQSYIFMLVLLALLIGILSKFYWKNPQVRFTRESKQVTARQVSDVKDLEDVLITQDTQSNLYPQEIKKTKQNFSKISN